jgi:23S rRNA (guanosine2251-2'-O)-methyltransferase
MTEFMICQCNDPGCNLRMPIDPGIHCGAFCPRCGARMDCVVGGVQHSDCSQQVVAPARHIEVILDNVRSAYNVGAIFRTADGVGVKRVYLCGITPNPKDNPSIGKTALGAEIDIPWTYYSNACTLARDLRDKNHCLLALECTPQSIPIQKYCAAPPKDMPLVLVVGNERAGVDPGLIELCEAVLSLPMMGSKASLNVAVAFGVAAYWLSFG